MEDGLSLLCALLCSTHWYLVWWWWWWLGLGVCVCVCVFVRCVWRHDNGGHEQVGVKKSPQWLAIRNRNRTNSHLRTSFSVWIAQGVQLRGTLSILWRMAGRRRCEQTATKRTSRRGDATSSAIAEDCDCTTPDCQATSKPDLSCRVSDRRKRDASPQRLVSGRWNHPQRHLATSWGTLEPGPADGLHR